MHIIKITISLKRKLLFQKEKCHSSVFRKAFQISKKYFSCHIHFKAGKNAHLVVTPFNSQNMYYEECFPLWLALVCTWNLPVLQQNNSCQILTGLSLPAGWHQRGAVVRVISPSTSISNVHHMTTPWAMPDRFVVVWVQYWNTVLSLWILFFVSGIETLFVQSEFVEVQPPQKSNLEWEI